MATPFRRAASMTMPPAITSTSLLASAIVLRASMAASTASSASVPDDAHRTMSTSGWVATATSPSRPVPASVTPCEQPPRARRRSAARSVEIATIAGRYRATCAARRSAFSPAASPTTCRRSLCVSTTDKALWPIEPVDPRIATRRRSDIPEHHVVDRRREQQGVDAIEDAAVAGYQRGTVLHARAPLEHRFEEVAGHAKRHDGDAKQYAHRQRHR